MRKRIVIGVLALAIVGAIAAVVFRPWESPVEHYKRVYYAGPKGGTWLDHLIDKWDRALGRTVPEVLPGRGWHHREIARNARAQSELLNLGYLEQRTFVFSNGLPGISNFWSIYWSNFYSKTNELTGQFQQWGTNFFTVIAPRKDMFKWENAVRQADMPENGK